MLIATLTLFFYLSAHSEIADKPLLKVAPSLKASPSQQTTGLENA